MSKRLEDLTLRDALVVAAVLGGRSYEWSRSLYALDAFKKGVTPENFECVLHEVMAAEARAVVYYVDNILFALEKEKC